MDILKNILKERQNKLREETKSAKVHNIYADHGNVFGDKGTENKCHS